MTRKNEYIHEIARLIGGKVRLARLYKGISCHDLAKSIGVSYQQLTKYERGLNNISPGRLLLIAKALKQNVSSFYKNLDSMPENLNHIHGRIYDNVMRDFMNINNVNQQKSVAALIKALT